ncbi:serine/threonine-protein kinase [Streptomyces sp. NRRL B-1347]|uniref:serine/threonine-protein kinase n=1 Tax=Streptomyces sp. NRRL B-1347 TaxID=1476877 RepID=UPI0004C8B3BD|nr:serine/threonine-protein kinase [Streptomyces sp. NRRL B-1347]
MSGQGDVVDGRFELVERLGSGGMGTVWRARDTVLHREVALKEVRPPGPEPTGEASAVLRERVLREARALARLNHPHVVTIHQIIDTDAGPHPWLVMELLSGRTLQDLLEERTLSPRDAARLGRQLLTALRFAHAAGVLHRDIKPANILLREEQDPGALPAVVLTDFGIAALQGSSRLTATGELIGSPEYIAPERVRGTGEGPAADLWSLGLVLYVAVEGVSPLRRATTLATLAAVLDDPVPPPVRSGPLAPVLTALLVRDPGRRPDAERLDAMLAAVAEDRPPVPHLPSAPPAPPDAAAYTPTVTAARPEPPAAPRRRTPVVVAAVAVVIAVVAGTALALALRGEDEPDDKAGGRTTDSAGPSPRRTPTKSPSPAPSSASPVTTPPQKPSPRPSTERTPSATATRQGPLPGFGRWVAQLHSEPDTSSPATRDRKLAAVRRQVPEAQYLHSDDYASLRPGFWVFYAPGPFADGRAALRFCAERGRTSEKTCIGRFLSGSGADLVFQCKPPASSPQGRCTGRP